MKAEFEAGYIMTYCFRNGLNVHSSPLMLICLPFVAHHVSTFVILGKRLIKMKKGKSENIDLSFVFVIN